MKDRVRESLFNLLGPAIKGTYAIDLFGGTGALALEAMSRGSVGAVIIERHLPTVKVIRENIATLGLGETVELVASSAFRWCHQQPELPDAPWVVFISPPYRFFTERCSDMLKLISELLDRAPSGSLIAVEATKEFEFDQLPCAEHWDVRTYSPAVVALLKVTDSVRNGSASGST
jgi:16S rRNA (guanine966-N2)-methyltransferase